MRALLSLLLIALACCTHSRPVAYQADTAAPRSLTFFVSGLFFEGPRYVADGRYLVEEHNHYNGRGRMPLLTQTKAALTPAQWIRFWQEVDTLGIGRWKPSYFQPNEPTYLAEPMASSTVWSVDLRQHGKLIHCEGKAYYPEKGNPARPTRRTDALEDVVHLFDRYTPSSPLH